MRCLLALVLLAPTASAGVPFVLAIEDATGDTVTLQGRPVDVPQADILRFRSDVVDGRVVQRVEMAHRPTAPADSMLVRNWFGNSTNGSWHALDLEVRGDAPDPADRFKPVLRVGDFWNVTPVDARYGVEGSTWVFEFDAALVADAGCFDPGAFAEHSPRGGRQGLDAVFLQNERRCRQTQEPKPPAPPPIVVGIPSPAPASEPFPEPPGSRTPTPGAGAGVVVALVALAAWGRARQRR